MNVSKRVRFGAALLVAAVTATACSDVPSAPAASRRAADASLGRGYSSGPQHRDYTNDDDSSLPDDPNGKKDPRSGSATFVVDPNESRSYKFGPHSVFIPAHAICDPRTAGYGEELWNSSCETLREPITISVSWEGKGGHGAVSFQPDLRFAPSSNPARWVVLTLRDRKLISVQRAYAILWESSKKGWIDESATDPSLRAFVSRTENTVYRRLKHFSGYLVAASAFSLDDDKGGFGGFHESY
jgi:hypothetical protein